MRRSSALALIVSLLALVEALPGAAQYQPWEGASIVDDPEWRKRFLGSYGFLSGAEPDLGPTEIALMREVLDVMRVNPRAAASMLEPQVGPESSAALDFVLANLEFQNGQLDAASEHYRSALEKFPDFRRAHKNLGLLMVQQGDFPRAIEHLSRAVELGDRDGRSYGLLGYAYLHQQNPLAADVAYRNAILQDPDTRDWKLGLTRSLLSLRHYAEAAALLDTLIEDRPDDSTLWLLQANAYIGLEQPLEAAVDLETVRMMGKASSSSLTLLGDIYMNAGMFEFARSAYVEVVESDQGATQFETAYRAAELLIRARSHGDAAQVLASIARRYPKLPLDDELRVLTLRAKVARARGEDREAARLLEDVVQRDGTRGDALLELAAYYEDRDDRERALLMIERAQRLPGFEYKALIEHARLRVASRDYAEAAALLRKALQIKREPRIERYLASVENAVRER